MVRPSQFDRTGTIHPGRSLCARKYKLPKVQAAMDFVQVSKTMLRSLPSLEDLADFDHETGTRIISD